LDRRGDNAWRTILVELKMMHEDAGDIHPFYAHPVFQADTPIGVITSAAYGHRCNKHLAFALLREHKIINDLSTEILGVRYPLEVLESVPVDPDNQRLKA